MGCCIGPLADLYELRVGMLLLCKLGLLALKLLELPSHLLKRLLQAVQVAAGALLCCLCPRCLLLMCTQPGPAASGANLFGLQGCRCYSV